MEQDLGWEGTPLWAYFCQISDSTTSYGSYSGAVPNEKITWALSAKIDVFSVPKRKKEEVPLPLSAVAVLFSS